MPLKIGVVCEAAADFRIATALIERALAEFSGRSPSDVADDLIWQGPDDHRPFLAWTEAKNRANAMQVRLRWKFREGAAQPDALAALRAITVLKRLRPDLHAIVLVRDGDGDERRRAGLEQARREAPELPIILGVAQTKRECWVLAGFDPRNAAEQTTLRRLRGERGFHPCEAAENLTASKDDADRSAKRVRSELTHGDPDREAVCWRDTPLDVLRRRGAHTGLRDFLDEVDLILAPLLAGARPEA